MKTDKYTTRMSYIEKTTLNDSTGEVNVTSTTVDSKNIKSNKEMLGDYLGVGRYFIIFCLIMFFIAPVYSKLNNEYKWNVIENGNTYAYENPKNNVSDYKELGNDMMKGFTETLQTIGNLGESAGTLVETVGKPLGWFRGVCDSVLNGFNSVLDWFNGLFD